MMLWHELDTNAPATSLRADELMRALLKKFTSSVEAPSRHGREILATHTLRRLCDFVESSLDADGRALPGASS